MTMGDLYQRTMEKKRYLEGQGYIYVGKWECEFDREVRENDTLRNFVQQSEMINPLEPRDAFYGGRTEAFTLFQKDQDISYVDVTSLYPKLHVLHRVNNNLLFIFTGNTGMYSPLGGRILHLMSPSYCCISVKPSVTISGCPMGIFPVILIYGYREVTSTYDISWSF
jgi:hypothetical protein